MKGSVPTTSRSGTTHNTLLVQEPGPEGGGGITETEGGVPGQYHQPDGEKLQGATVEGGFVIPSSFIHYHIWGIIIVIRESGVLVCGVNDGMLLLQRAVDK